MFFSNFKFVRYEAPPSVWVLALLSVYTCSNTSCSNIHVQICYGMFKDNEAGKIKCETSTLKSREIVNTWPEELGGDERA